MTQSVLFSSGFELATFVKSSVLLRKSCDVITSRYAGIISTVGEGISWKVYREPQPGLDFTIIAFEVTQDSSNLQADLVPSNALREKNFHHFDFLCTKKDPDFSFNSTAISLLYVNYEKLDQLISEINSSTPLVVTGHGLGGSVASLFTISLLDSRGSGKNRPLCISYGSPLIGDKRLQQAISRSSNWNSCFLHVVSLKDPLPRLFITNCSSSAASLTPQTSAYMPFGTFFLCSDANSTCFEWYKKKMKNEEIGYYDSYKKMNSPWDHDVNGFHKKLKIYWEDMVEEAEMKPQKEGAAFLTRWLYAGTNYRRMVEPLAIAQYYREGGKDYVANGRSRHYKVLEEWLKEGTKNKNDASNTSRKNVELILTIDSCFWAKVEEALLQLENVNEKEEAKGKLREFEDHVYGSLKKYEVSPEIFLKKSSYMTWWNQYKEISHNPGLASFMSNPVSLSSVQ